MLHHFLTADVDLFLEEQPFLDDHDLLEDRYDDRVAFLSNGRRGVHDTVDREALYGGFA